MTYDYFHGRRVMVTGASGFIGHHLCQHLMRRGAQVYAISRRSVWEPEDNIFWHQVDFADPAEVTKTIRTIKPDLVFHLGAHVTGRRDLDAVLPLLHANLVATINILRTVAEVGCKRIVLAGSMEEPDEGEQAPIPCSPYSASKWAAAAYARMFHGLYGVDVVNARLFMTYGPGQRDTAKLIPYVVRCFLQNESPKLSSGTRLVDWIYVDDAVDGIIALAQSVGTAGQSVDIGSGNLVSIHELVERIRQLSGARVNPSFGAVADRPLERVRKAKVLETKAKIHWECCIPLEIGLTQTWNWYKQQIENNPGEF